MGWKALKQHYRIDHDVQVVPDKGICIGSAYVHDLIVVTRDGEVRPNRIVRREGLLGRYMDEMESDPAKLRELIACEDTFERSIRVYTYEAANIIEGACEELGWPNVTHDGRMMYENTFSPDREQVVEWALRNARAGVEGWSRRVSEAERDLAEVRGHLARCESNLAELTARVGAPA